jgi:uncharacterized protein (DUF2344 family)
LIIKSSGDETLVCSNQSIVALADYLSRFVLCNSLVFETEKNDSPDIDIWFLYGCEVVTSDFDELPKWIQEIMQLLINEKIVVEISFIEEKYYCIPKYQQYEGGKLPSEILSKIERICKRYLVEDSELQYRERNTRENV